MKEAVAGALFRAAACVCVVAVALICLFLFANALPALARIGAGAFLTGTVWRPAAGLYGIAPMLLGSLYAAAGALVCGGSAGVLTAVFLACFCGKRLLRLASPAVALLAGIPSVIYGFFALTALVPLLRPLTGGSGKSLLAASLLLGMMILPTIISVSEAAIRAVPGSYYEGAVALGAGHERAVFFAVLPAARQGIAAGVVLGLGRAIGETMAVIMVAGNQAVMPASLFRGVRTLTATIALEMGYAADLHRGALIACAAVLFAFILAVNMLLSLFRTGRDKG